MLFCLEGTAMSTEASARRRRVAIVSAEMPEALIARLRQDAWRNGGSLSAELRRVVAEHYRTR